MTMASPQTLTILSEMMKSNVTSVTHKTSYPAISPTRPELNQAGRVVLITGGGTGVGKSMAHHFALASASHVIIAGRRVDVLEKALVELKKSTKEAGSPTQFLSYKLDVASKSEITDVFKDLSEKKLEVDVLVLNAAKFATFVPIMDLGMDELWSFMEANMRSAMLLTEMFLRQNLSKQKYLVNVTSAMIHTQQNPFVVNQAPYFLSKAGAALFIQAIANQVPRDQLQVVTFHPGTIHGSAYDDVGIKRDALAFDEFDLPGAFGVWAASNEAAFLHGRTVWAAWDVEELAKGDVKKLIEADDDYLKVSVVGLKNSNRAPGY